jgi:tRNA threonylcarbamoyl adenosine modification protein (Sua5/YciO/YrdC/YwlC family)
MPAPVLVGSVRAAGALVEDFGTYGHDLLEEFWPGALTVVCRANRNLTWDLGETKGTVALRMPLHELALELLKETGPMAVSSANLSGAEPARTVAAAQEQLGDAVAVYLDGGRSGDGPASSIVDLTGPIPRLLRVGAISEDALRELLGVLLVDEDKDDESEAEAGSAVEDKPVDQSVATDKPTGESPTKPVDESTDKPADKPDKREEPAGG